MTSSEKIVEVKATKSEETVQVLKPAVKVTDTAGGEFSGNPQHYCTRPYADLSGKVNLKI